MFNRMGLVAVVLGVLSVAGQAAPIGLRNFREILISLEIISGIDSKTPAVQDVYKRVATRLPIKGEVNEMSSPMLLALTELVGVVCKEMVAEQAKLTPGERLYFSGVDFKKTNKQFTPALKEEVLGELVSAFWQRDFSDEEKATVKELFDQSVASLGTNPSDVNKALFMTCVQLGTSVGFLTY